MSTETLTGDVTIGGVEYVRVYAGELAPGMVDSFGDTIDCIEDRPGERVAVHYVDADSGYYRRTTTKLITLSSFVAAEWEAMQ